MSDFLTDSERSRMRALITTLSGPAPWYWNTFPQVSGFEWTFHGQDGPLAFVVTLNKPERKNDPVLALNTYCAPFALPDGKLGVWSPEGRRMIRLVSFDPKTLKPFPLEEIAGWFKGSGDRMYSTVEPVGDFELSADLPDGMHEIQFPTEFHGIEELPISAGLRSGSEHGVSYAVYVLYPHAGLVQVLPQEWLSGDKFDGGYQWITRLTRDPVTHRLIGDGIRIDPFCLSEDGKNLESLLA